MAETPGELEVFGYYKAHLGPRYMTAGLRIQFHYNQLPGIHFKVPAADDYRAAIVQGLEDGLADRFPRFPADGSIWIVEVVEDVVDSSQVAFYRAGRMAIDQAFSYSQHLMPGESPRQTTPRG